jgi:hypothetical protein
MAVSVALLLVTALAHTQWPPRQPVKTHSELRSC